MVSPARPPVSEQYQPVQQTLQASLHQGWQAFVNSSELPLLQDFFAFLQQAGFDESCYRQAIPNPAYDNAAKAVGRPFLRAARELGLQFDEVFPGRFPESQERDATDCEGRTFYLTAYAGGEPWGRLVLTFWHYHQRLAFPYPPELALESLAPAAGEPGQ
ncbi:MAG: hypothetical protein BRC58_09200 [Cyanobacteria bacterium QS_8_64_29]|nr:MAG: hypothetical protein BRC58_09200 [Cyanobacteria bacterium QS_8_64_29]